MGWQAPCARMGRTQQAQMGQVMHGVADRGWRQVHAAARYGAGAHRLASFQIGLDHPAKNIPRPLVQLRHGRGLQGDGADIEKIGHDLGFRIWAVDGPPLP